MKKRSRKLPMTAFPFRFFPFTAHFICGAILTVGSQTVCPIKIDQSRLFEMSNGIVIFHLRKYAVYIANNLYAKNLKRREKKYKNHNENGK